MFVFPLQRLVRTTLSCLSVQVNAKPAHMKHDDVFLNMCEGVCVCILCPYAALPALRSLQHRHSY